MGKKKRGKRKKSFKMRVPCKKKEVSIVGGGRNKLWGDFDGRYKPEGPGKWGRCRGRTPIFRWGGRKNFSGGKGKKGVSVKKNRIQTLQKRSSWGERSLPFRVQLLTKGGCRAALERGKGGKKENILYVAEGEATPSWEGGIVKKKMKGGSAIWAKVRNPPFRKKKKRKVLQARKESGEGKGTSTGFHLSQKSPIEKGIKKSLVGNGGKG